MNLYILMNENIVTHYEILKRFIIEQNISMNMEILDYFYMLLLQKIVNKQESDKLKKCNNFLPQNSSFTVCNSLLTHFKVL